MRHSTVTPPIVRLAGVAALALTALAVPTAAVAEPVEIDFCPDDAVTVVVDFVDLGGEVEVGCATPGVTGSEALLEAGFIDTRDTFTMICAIDGLPDPCPEEFTGEFWSYWYAEDGAWQMYLEGSDTAVTVAGGVEGWRYSDGSEGPQVALPGAAEEPAEPTEEPAEETSEEPAEETTPETPAEETTEEEVVPTEEETPEAEILPISAEEPTGLSTAAIAGIALAVVLAGAAVVIGLRRRQATLSGEDTTGSAD